MRDKLRNRYQVHREVARNGSFEGEIRLSEMSRLMELLHLEGEQQRERKIALSFAFSRSEYDLPMVSGQVQAELQLECQRCLQPMDVPLSLDFSLLVDASDDIVQHSSQDTLYSDDGYIDIVEVVEDELILAVPLVATHEDRDCNSDWLASASTAETSERENPFAVLEQLKTTN